MVENERRRAPEKENQGITASEAELNLLKKIEELERHKQKLLLDVQDYKRDLQGLVRSILL